MGTGLTVNLVGADGVHCTEGNGQCGNVSICSKYLLQYKLEEKCIGCMGSWLISDQESTGQCIQELDGLGSYNRVNCLFFRTQVVSHNFCRSKEAFPEGNCEECLWEHPVD